MKSTGIVRRIDDLGRLIVPKEIIKRLGINDGQAFQLFTIGKGVCFLPYHPGTYDNELEEQGEYEYILDFVEGCENIEVDAMHQLRALWTAYCLHYDLDIDTAEYDNRMMEIWNVMQETGNSPYSSLEYERFYIAMGKYLI